MASEDLEQQLKELRARYRVMVEHAPEAIIVFDLDSGKFVEANEPACQLFGMERARLLTVGPVEMSPERQPDGQLSSEAATALIARAMAGEIQRFNWLHVDAAGTPVLCRIQLARVPSEHAQLVRANLVDISETVESEKARARLEAIIDATPDIVGLAGTDGKLRYVNPAGRALLAIPTDADVSRYSFSDFHDDRWTEAIRARVEEISSSGGVWRGETEFRSLDGNAFPASQVVIAHHDQHGNLEYVSTIARDISERRTAEQLQRKVQHAQKLESLGILAGGIAHDLNNILVGILANASLVLQRTADDDPTAELLREVRDAAARAGDLAQQMLDYAGKGQTKKTELQLSCLASDASDLVAASISKSARLGFEFGDDVPPIVGDATQLRQVLMNLIINASDALGPDPGDIRVRTAVETLDRARLMHNYLPARRNGSEHVLLEVSDTGPGIDAPLDRIFDPFFTTKFAGRGLGLAAVMGIVKAHEGGIELESSPSGTTFRLWFAPAPERPPAAAAPERRDTGPWSARGTVLLVDDEDLVRRALRSVLEDLGFDVIEADDGDRAEELYRARSTDVVAVILDVTMPGRTGHDVLETLRAIDPDPRILLTSGFSDTVDTSAADGFLGKPFTAQQVETALRKVLT